MTTITIDRAVVEQALEALEKTIVLHDPMRLAAVAALKAALAQERKPVTKLLPRKFPENNDD